jgi:Lon protease-like protein
MFSEPSCSSAEPSPCPIPQRIPIFPLPQVVFFPKTYLPLHIFEPRYRQMVADAANSGNCIGMALLKERWEENYYGHPPIYELGCVGRVINVEYLADGRSNIVLQGLCRYKIVDEYLDLAPYRQACITLAAEADSAALTSSFRADLLAVLRDLLSPRQNEQDLGQVFAADVSDEVLINTLSAIVDFTPLEKQLLLEADTVLQRARRLSDLLQFKRYERNDRKGRG